MAFNFDVHELIPEDDQYPPDWNEWPVEHDYQPLKPMERNFVQIYKTSNEAVITSQTILSMKNNVIHILGPTVLASL